nr:glycosyltransferase [Planctomicrobium sp.]
MKLLMIIPTLDQSGAEKQFCLLAEGLSIAGIDVEVVVLTRGGPLEQRLSEAGIPVTILEKRFRFDLFVLRKLRKIILDRSPDVALSYLFAGNSSLRLALLGITRKRPKVLISERCVDSWKSRWQIALDRYLQPFTDLLIANSESVAEYYQSKGFPAEKIRVVPNGVIVPEMSNLSQKELCEAANIPIGSRCIAYIGRLAPQKRLKDLLWAIQMLRLSHPDSYLLIIGEGPLKDELLDYARTTEAETHVRFLGHRDDASSLLHLVDAFWLGSEFEGMSNSLMEAMSCGKPVVVSDIPSNRELVEHGVSGWIANLGDSAGFTQYTVRLLEDAKLSEQIGHAAQKRMADHFSIQAMVDTTESILNEITEA